MTQATTRKRIDRGRFRLTRAGIFNIWQYDDQVFEFHQGRLLLRGKNGSGKTKALELLLPFLLDANLSPTRLDPAGENVKGMKYNLLDNDQGSRTGYAWIEFGRIREDGATEYVTLGAGLRASASAPTADAWYFLTRQRIGLELRLEGDGGHPLTREKLRNAIGTNGKICDSAGDYKAEVDEKLFGLGKERYQALVDLLIHLRRPQLSKSLNPELLASALSESLPPLDEEMITGIAEAFHELERQQRDLADVRRARDAVSQFLGSYETYAGTLSRSKARAVISTKKKLETAGKAIDKIDQRLGELTNSIGGLDTELQEFRREEADLKGRLKALAARPEAKKAEELAQLARFVKSLREDADRLRDEMKRVHSDLQTEEAKVREAKKKLDECGAADRKMLDELSRLAKDARAETIHELLKAARDGDGRIPRETEARWSQRMSTRANDLRLLEAATEAVKRAEGDQQTRDEERQRADETHRQNLEASQQSRNEVEEARENAETSIDAWRAELKALRLRQEDLDALLASLEEAELAQNRHLTLLQEFATAQHDTVVDDRTKIETERNARAKHAAKLNTDIERWRTEKDSPPPAPAWLRRERSSALGAAFYRVVDFREDVTLELAARLEAALAGAGVLDAWITPQGEIDKEELDLFITQAPPPGVESLDGYLRPVQNPDVATPIIERILRAIPVYARLSEEDGSQNLAIGLDGTWVAGPLRGRTTKAKAEHIGELAREEARLKRIDAALDELRGVEADIAALNLKIAEKNALIQLIRAEANAFPNTGELARRYRALATALSHEERSRNALMAAQRRLATARETVLRRQGERRDVARERGLEDVIDILPLARDNLQSYRDRCAAWFRAVDATALAAEALAERTRRAKETGQRLGNLQGQHEQKNAQAVKNDGQLKALQASSGKAIAQLQREIHEAEERQLEVEGFLRSKSDERTARLGDEREEKLKHEIAVAAQAEAERLHADATAELGALRPTGLIELGVGAELPSTNEIELASFVLERTEGAPEDRAALDAATNLVYPKFQALTRDLSNEYAAASTIQHDAFVVTITHAGKESTARQMHASLDQEVAVQSALLDRREADLIEKHLFKQASAQIRARIRKAQDLVADMNGQLEAHPTASGLKMRLKWGMDPEIGKPAERALGAIKKPQTLITDAEKKLVTEFLQNCQRKAREEHATANSTEQLTRALDYRRWFRFDLEWKKPGQSDFARLTKKTHATGSAGEKAVALYLPLFSAAAAHFNSARPEAPRVVLLDEVFAGVDQTTRGSCMGLTVKFDLDIMMTAFSEWACYPEVPGIAIYHLDRNENVRGVLAVPYWWDGKIRRDLHAEDPA